MNCKLNNILYHNFSYRIVLILSIILIFTFSDAFASVSDTIYISKHDKKQEYSIADKIRILEDNTRLLTIKEVTQASGFVKNTKEIDYEASESTYWLKFTIANMDEFSDSKRYILFTTVDIHEFRFYHFDEKNNLKAADTTGNIFPYKKRALYTHEFVFPVSLEPKAINTFYVYLDHRYQILSTDIKLLTDEKLIEKSTRGSFYSGVIMGSAIMFMLIALSLLLFFKKEIHLNYLIYVIGVIIFFLSLKTGSRYIWHHWPYFQDPSQYIGPMLLLTGFIGVFRLFFHLKTHNIVLDRFFQILRLIALFLVTGFFFWKYLGSYYTVLYEIMGMFFFICFVFSMSVSLYIYNKDRKEEYIWFISSMILMMVTASSILLIEQTSLDRKDFEFVFVYLPDLTLYYESAILCFFLVRRVYREKIMSERNVMKERERIHRGLHDEVIAGLAGIRMAFANLINEFDKPRRTRLSIIRDQMDSIISDIREVMNDLSSDTKYLDEIIAEIRRFALEQFENKKTNSGFNVSISENKTENIVIPIQLRRNLKGFFKEIIHNSVKYSKAENFWTEIEMKANKLTCFICDDGVGFDYQKGIEEPIGDGNGLRNLEKRAEQMKATTYSYKTQPGKGVKILLKIDFKQFNESDYI